MGETANGRNGDTARIRSRRLVGRKTRRAECAILCKADRAGFEPCTRLVSPKMRANTALGSHASFSGASARGRGSKPARASQSGSDVFGAPSFSPCQGLRESIRRVAVSPLRRFALGGVP
jgi:hypothetical protein